MRKDLLTSFLAMCISMLGFGQTHEITFSIDMNTYPGNISNGVFINGTFNGWCGSCNPLDDSDMDGIWEVTLPLNTGEIEYKFTVDGWSDDETLTDGDPCTKTTVEGSDTYINRVYEVTAPVSLPTVCWETCEACPMLSPGDITFKVDMNEYDGAINNGVYINGTFNNWCGDCNPLDDSDMDGIWEATLPLDAGAIEYKFYVDTWTDEEVLAEGSPCTISTDDGSGTIFTNRFLNINGDAELDAVCWESCAACGTTSDITFRVDMNEYAGIFTEVQLNGTFNGWCGACTPMDDSDMDGIWEVTLTIDNGPIEYLFTYDNWAGSEAFAGGEVCTKTTDGGNGNIFINRSLDVMESATLETVCWESCYECGFVPQSGNVTFQVDMNEYGGSTAEGVFINGTFNEWCGTCSPLDDSDGDGVWVATITNLPLDTFEYKYTIGDWTVQEELTDGSECTQTTIDGQNTFVNRYIIVTQDAIVDTVCWNSCDACGVEPTTANVTFRVDMNDYTGSTAEGIFINGSFNNWCGTCNPMDDSDGDGVWEVALPVPIDTIEYKYTVGNWSDQETFTEGEFCTSTIDGFTNRSLIVTENIALDAACWNSCSACTGTAVNELDYLQLFEISPNPTKGSLTISLSLSEQKNVSVLLVDILGQTLISEAYNGSGEQIRFDVSSMAEGIYFVIIQAEEGLALQKVMIQP